LRQLLTERYRGRLAGVLSCYDRIIVTGTLPGACYAKGMTGFLSARQIRIFDYPRFADRFGIECASAPPSWRILVALSSNTLPRTTSARRTSSPRCLPPAATIPAWSISSRQWKPATATSPGTTSRRTAPSCGRIPANASITTSTSWTPSWA
jgi:hypothetical protein